MRQLDWTAPREAHYAETVERRLGRQDVFGVLEVAGVFGVAGSTVREWIEEGRLPAADLNAGRVARGADGKPLDPERPLRPYYRIERQAILDLAKRMEGGV